MTPDSVSARVAVLAERRRGVTIWAEHVWRVTAVLEEAPEVPPWTLLRSEPDGTALFFAGHAEIWLHPTDTDNYKHNLEAAVPLVWVLLRPDASEAGFALQAVTVDAGEAQIYAESGNDLLESLPLPPGLCAWAAGFVVRHHKERGFYKRKRDRADPEALARQARNAEARDSDE